MWTDEMGKVRTRCSVFPFERLLDVHRTRLLPPRFNGRKVLEMLLPPPETGACESW